METAEIGEVTSALSAKLPAYLLEDIVDFYRNRSGRYVVKCSVVQNANICELLYSASCRRRTLGGKSHYYLTTVGGDIQITMAEVRKEFISILKRLMDAEPLTEIERKIILNWFWGKKNLVRENNILKDYLSGKAQTAS